MSELKNGNILRLRTVRTYGEDGKSYFEYGMKKGLMLVVCILGVEPAAITEANKDQVIDIEAALNALGWFRQVDNNPPTQKPKSTALKESKPKPKRKKP